MADVDVTALSNSAALVTTSSLSLPSSCDQPRQLKYKRSAEFADPFADGPDGLGPGSLPTAEVRRNVY